MVGALGALAGGTGIAIVITAIDKFSNVFANVNAAMLATGAVITGIGIAGASAVGGLVKLAGQFEQTQIAFTTMLGDADQANKLLQELADFATKTPFTITGVEASAKQLLAMGIETDKLIPTLKSLGDISAGLNVPLDRLALNFGQVAIQGKLTGRELRDFAVAGVPLVAELAKNLGVSEAAIAEMVSAGEIGFDDVEMAFTTMTSEGGKFFDLMDAQSKTFLGQVSNIQDSFIKLGRTMGEVFLPSATFVAEKLGIIIGWMEEHPKMIKFAAVVLGIGTALALIVGPLLMIVATLPVLIPLIVAGTVMLWGAVAATTAFTLANIWWIAIVVGVIAVIGLLIAAGIWLTKNWDKVKNAAVNLGIGIGNVFKGIANVVLTVWNFVVSTIENRINLVLRAINKIISAYNKFASILGLRRIGKLGMLSLSKFKAEMFELKEFEKFVPTTPESSANTVNNFNIENINGMTGADIAKSLQTEINKKVNLS